MELRFLETFANEKLVDLRLVERLYQTLACLCINEVSCDTLASQSFDS